MPWEGGVRELKINLVDGNKKEKNRLSYNRCYYFSLGFIIVAYINGCFSSKTANNNKTATVEQKVDSGIMNNAPVNQQNNQSNHVNGNQYNSGRDVIINELTTPANSPNKRTEGKQQKETKSQSQDQTLNIQENKGFVNVGGTKNIYNQTINPKPKGRHFTVEDLQKINAANPPRDFKVIIGFNKNPETETYAREIGGQFEQNGFEVSFISATTLVTPNPDKRFSININHERKEIKVMVQKQEE